MCGIAGIVSLNQRSLEPPRIKQMCDVLAHRGPDDAGYTFFRVGKKQSGEGGYWCGFADPKFQSINEHLPVFDGSYCRDELSKGSFSVALGHRRLSILDLTHYGHQPMSSSDRRYWITYYGEIYNFPELREKLISRGHIFRTRCDTEIILHLWEEYGKDCLLMLNGMFAFAIYDRLHNVLTLARDRFGVKPLYYAIYKDFLVFASEIKGILASEILKPEINFPSLTEYFTFQNTFTRQTIFENIYILQLGEFLEIVPTSGKVPTPCSYHTGFEIVDLSLSDESKVADRVAESFHQAVERQLISDVEVGSYLSGGMDSGSIVSVIGQILPRLLTFTGGFDLTNVNGIEQGFDERKQAEQLSYLLQTEHYDVVLHAGDMPAAMEKIAWHIDDPRVGMCHQNWYVAKLASKFVKVCLAGAGGDELFGGYPWRYRQGINASNVKDFDDAYFRYWYRLLAPENLPQLFNPDLRNNIASVRERFQSVMDKAPVYQNELSLAENLLQRAFYFEFKTFLHGFLVIEDHISMAHSLETRVPFLDNQLADLAWQIPPALKVNVQRLLTRSNGHQKFVDGKNILRKAMRQYLPETFTQQHKQGFSPPDENWFRGPSMDYIKSILLDSSALERGWFDKSFVQKKLDEHFQGHHNHRLLIWSLLSFEWLQRHFVDKS